MTTEFVTPIFGHRISMASVSIAREFFGAGADLRPSWISQAEWQEGAIVTHPGRRRQWLAGRRVAKQMLADRFSKQAGHEIPLDQISVRSRDSSGRPMAPQAWLRGKRLALALSISHSSTAAVAALSDACRPGIDLVTSRGSIHERFAELGIGPLDWSLIEAAFKTEVTSGRFQPFRWKVSRTGLQTYTVRVPNQSDVPGQVLWLDGSQVALCWRDRERLP